MAFDGYMRWRKLASGALIFMFTLEKLNRMENTLPSRQFRAIIAGDEGEIMLLESRKEWSQYGSVRTKSNGYVIWENSRLVAIATGFAEKSANEKTGAMIQVWILVKSHGPIEANRLGEDRKNCGGCPLKGQLSEITGKIENRVCYVNLGQAPEGVYKAWRRGSYPEMPTVEIFRGKSVRLGAYGDPAFLPFLLIKSICETASSWTGYTHQWRAPVFAAFKRYLMASVEDEGGAVKAHQAGWRTFRIVNTSAERLANEIMCANERNGMQCNECGECAGTARNEKSIMITAHGVGKANF